MADVKEKKVRAYYDKCKPRAFDVFVIIIKMFIRDDAFIQNNNNFPKLF